MNLDEMEGFGGEIPFKNYQDDIIPLLEQPDSDSYLSPDVCQTVAARLRQLIHHWPDDDIDKMNALYLAEGMELAHQHKSVCKILSSKGISKEMLFFLPKCTIPFAQKYNFNQLFHYVE
ncbi:hypothetical protein [Bacillus safensis]|uniref:hypothetical protein n=1 Tax=Bacillus safensis TaxID=561879 RepID=UPI00366F2B00